MPTEVAMIAISAPLTAAILSAGALFLVKLKNASNSINYMGTEECKRVHGILDNRLDRMERKLDILISGRSTGA